METQKTCRIAILLEQYWKEGCKCSGMPGLDLCDLCKRTEIILRELGMISTEPSLNPRQPALPTVHDILDDLAASDWIKQALSSALARDPVDAANDAEVLARVLDRHSRCWAELTADFSRRSSP